MNITNLKIDMEFASKIPPLTGEELMRLHESILTEGRCISPIVDLGWRDRGRAQPLPLSQPTSRN